LVVMCKMVVLVGWCGKKLVVLCGCDVEVGQQTEWRYTDIYTNRKLRAGLVVKISIGHLVVKIRQ
jgi:hypothetical protein